MRNKIVLAALAAFFVFQMLGGNSASAALKSNFCLSDSPFEPALQSQQAPQILRMTLSDCIHMALAANLDLSIEALNPAMDELSSSETREKYLPEFSLRSNYLNQDIPSTWGVEGPTVFTKMDYHSLNITQRIVLGTEVTLSLFTRRTDTSRAFTTVNPSYFSQLEISLFQPLLRGFGPKINRYETTKANYRLDTSMSTLKSTLLQTIYSVEEAYWNLYYARENLRVMELSLAQSLEIFHRNQEAARIGTKSAIEVMRSETEVAGYEDRILSARLQVVKMENRLKLLLNMPVSAGDQGQTAEPAQAGAKIIPIDEPKLEKRSVTFEEALQTALARRPEISRSQNLIAGAALDASYYKNQLLPQLDLQFSLWYPGQSGVRYLFLDDNPLTGIVVGRIVGSRAESFKDIFKQTYRNLSVNLTLTIPLANIISRASLARAKIAQNQAQLDMEKERRTIEFDVRDAIDDLETSARKIETTARYRELMEKQVAAETQRYQLGLVGSEWLFTYQRNLASAKADEIRAVIDYKIALAKLDKAMGTTLGSKGLKFQDYSF
jgi:outer membrane protein TolC